MISVCPVPLRVRLRVSRLCCRGALGVHRTPSPRACAVRRAPVLCPLRVASSLPGVTRPEPSSAACRTAARTLPWRLRKRRRPRPYPGDPRGASLAGRKVQVESNVSQAPCIVSLLAWTLPSALAKTSSAGGRKREIRHATTDAGRRLGRDPERNERARLGSALRATLRKQQRHLCGGPLPDEPRQQPLQQLVHTGERKSVYRPSRDCESVRDPATFLQVRRVRLRRVRPLAPAIPILGERPRSQRDRGCSCSQFFASGVHPLCGSI